MIYYVRKNADSLNNGTAEHPFSTISQAAKIAVPGDTVLIGEGIYREWVSPAKGGSDENNRITYKNIDGESPVISGSELISDWTLVENNIYMTKLPISFFGDYCPYTTEVFGDWYNPLGQVHHTGEVFADGAALYEAASLDSITSKQRNSWFSQCDDKYVTIWVYMPESAPSDHKMELSARPFGFFPKEEGRNYITVSGLTIENVATQWAPPTAFQTGAIGPNWSKGWIIENCTVRNSKCSGISIGKRREAQDNRWSIDPIKGGAQTYTEVIFTNLSKDWSKENIGSHIIRNNTIYNCGQTGIVGCMGGAFSTIENNRIFNIAIRNEFTGAEIGGIKLHAGIDVIIKNNVIFNATRGIWFDWESQGVRITRNLLFNNESDDLCLELNHGPMLIDNNISLSYTSILNESQGTAFVHNIFAGATYLLRETKRFSMYHLPHDTAVLGSIFVYGGDDKIYNNIYIGHNKNWYYPGRPATHISGNSEFNNYRDSSHRPDTSKNDCPTGESENTLGVFFGGNSYFYGAQQCSHETDAKVDIDFPAYCRVVCENGDYYLETNLPDELFTVNHSIVDTKLLGKTFQSNAPYENRDGSPVSITEDYFGNSRNEANPCGPFAAKIPAKIFLFHEDNVAI